MYDDLNGVNVGVVHDWLPVLGGAEKVVQSILEIFPDHELYTLFNFLNEEDLAFINPKKLNVSPLNNFPYVEKYYRNLLLLCTRQVEQFDVSSHDVVLSSSAALAKGVLTGVDQPHICYMHSPARYAWDLSHQYINDITGSFAWIKRKIARELVYRFRFWDSRSTATIDHILANSNFIKNRIAKVYKRESTVIYPPVNIDDFCIQQTQRDSYYVTASRLVPYKKTDLVVKAFAQRRDRKLIVIGDGPELNNLKSIATQNIEFVGYQSLKNMVRLIQGARAFVFAAFEDFGIVPVEAQACGTPVICYAHGGTSETVRNSDNDYPTGVYFWNQHEADINIAIDTFEKNIDKFSEENCRKNAEYFSNDRFKTEVSEFVMEKLVAGTNERK